jgi:hypothetical protein
MRLVLLFLVLACETGPAAPRGVALDVPHLPPPGEALSVDVTGAAPGAPLTLHARNADPGETIHFVVNGSGSGVGPCPSVLDGLCVDLSPPFFRFSSVADAGGEAWFDVDLPASIDPSRVLGVQAFALRDGAAGDSVGSDVVESPLSEALPEACYPGLDEDWTTCMALEDVDPGPDYVYPEPLDGSAQYREPVLWLDLTVEDPAMHLAPNFLLDEIAQEWKGPYAVVQPHAIERLQDMRDELGALIINSGYRSPEYNETVDGVTWSRHIYGDAFDIDPVSVSLDTLADTCAEHGAGYVGVYVDHIHCDWRDDPVDVGFFGPAPILNITTQPYLRAEPMWVGEALTTTSEGWDEGEPLREWTAFDAQGRVLAEARGQTWVPPEGTARIRCTVGKALEVWIP